MTSATSQAPLPSEQVLVECARAGIRVESSADVITIVLDRPEARNAQTPASWAALTRLGEWVGELRPAPVAVLLRGEGPSFSAGLDRRMLTGETVDDQPSLWGIATGSDSDLSTFIAEAQRAFQWWREVDPVTIAIVSGHAIGAGFQLALACDLLVAHTDAVFAMRETSWGLVPDLGGTVPLVRGAGYGPALEACATGRDITAAELHAWGLALVPTHEPAAAAERITERLRATPPGAVAELKRLLHSVDRDPDQWGREAAAQMRRLRVLARAMG